MSKVITKTKVEKQVKVKDLKAGDIVSVNVSIDPTKAHITGFYLRWKIKEIEPAIGSTPGRYIYFENDELIFVNDELYASVISTND